MINVIHKKCIFEDCNILPLYNFEGEKTAIYCTIHKKDDRIDIKKVKDVYLMVLK